MVYTLWQSQGYDAHKTRWSPGIQGNSAHVHHKNLDLLWNTP